MTPLIAEAKRRARQRRFLVGTAFLVLALTIGLTLGLGSMRGGLAVAGASPSKVASQFFGAKCDDSGLSMKPSIDGAPIETSLRGRRVEIYDCTFPRQLPACMVYDGVNAMDWTYVVRFNFKHASRRPHCLREQRIVHARRVARRVANRAAAAQARKSSSS